MSLVLTKDEESLRSEFLNLTTPQDVASLLDVKDYVLKYYLYILENSLKYFSYSIRKKSGGQTPDTLTITFTKDHSIETAPSPRICLLSESYCPRIC
jgi:hypothetical protein